ncbi:hypothetical protein [Clostridium magnum]|uniref:Uncharacterized protein n=1 Tax=Clostridium magnum DSM 2767 TaxID=1121326 RepID=A0A162QG93_9CLOT|nr:hypothetical protein [Clostridium magnum]KZL88504.1 hypothetical protein CLMAG_61590 [Clostridium magnum DSM 2767]SHJ12127.1 hypothetical protein SAMN02745944_05379 [Clostridium magnum DSM 2767]
MDFQDFETCKKCSRRGKCKNACKNFINSEQQVEIDRGFWLSGLRVDMARQVEGDRKTEEFNQMRNNLLNKINIEQTIQYATEENGFREAKVIQKTENFIAIRRENSRYVSVINFLDIYTRDVAVTNY